MKKPMLSLVGSLLCFCALIAQTTPETQPKPATIQPTIMVIPFAAEGQDWRKVLESDLNLRVAAAKMKEGFDKRGFSTIDLRARLKELSNDKAMEAQNQSSLKQEIIELSGADIYVEAEAKPVRTDQGNSITIILTAFDAFSGASLANKVATSPKFFTDNYERLTEKAMESVVEDFLNTLQMKFDDVVKNGRTAVINFTFSENATTDMDSEVGPDKKMLSEAIEDFLEKNTVGGKYHIQGTTATKMIIDEARIPLRDDEGKNYRVSTFVGRLRNYLKGLGVESSRDVKGNKIFITIQ